MATIRFKALEELFSRNPVEVKYPSVRVSDYYGENVFDRVKMQNYLSKEAYDSVLLSIDSWSSIDRKVADQVASGMQAWAIDRGATHYTHWFQPLTGATAEKHD